MAGLAAICRGQGPGADSPPAAFTIRADGFDRGNVRVSTPGQPYADKFACIWNAGELPNRAEYDLDFPVSGDYTIAALFAARTPRPVEVYLDGEKVVEGFTGATGSWQTSQARWKTQGTVRVEKGRGTIKLLCAGPMPHICALRFEASEPFPEDWRLDRPAARKVESAAGPIIPPAHFLLESAFARADAPPLRVEIVRGGKDPLLGPLAHNELVAEAHAPADASRTARLSFETAPGERRDAMLTLSPAALHTLVEQIVELIGHYRTLDAAGQRYLAGEEAEAAELAAALESLLPATDDTAHWQRVADLYLAAYRLRRRVALANPLLDFEEMLVLKRRFENARAVMGTAAGHPNNFQAEVNVRPTGWDNEIVVLSNVKKDPELETLFKPARDIILRKLDLDFDARKIMFSSVDDNNRWALFEVNVDGGGLRQLSPEDLPDVDFFDSCYLPDGRIITASTASYGGLDCVGGSSAMSDLYLLDPKKESFRQLTFDQVHPQHPTVRNDGSVLYQRWEYSDIPHYFGRFLFSMNPDGTHQRPYHSAGSFFPTAIMHAKPIPGHPTRTVAILGGHHGISESGRLAIIDPALARGYPFRYTPESLDWADSRPTPIDVHPEVLPAEKTGFVQEIPGYGKDVVGNVRDTLVNGVWPHFVYPHPLNGNYILVSMKPTPESLWGIYLVDVFDNMTLIKEVEGAALFEPIPLRGRKRPPVLPDRIDPNADTATMLIQDIYEGGGLAGVPRGTVDRLRIFAYHFSYLHTGNFDALSRGVQGPWDVRRILGTVPVETDGSVHFEVPADTPISIQPLDAEGRALQLMRSWTVGMPGETVSCIGCHEDMNQSPTSQMLQDKTFIGPPKPIEPWYGPPRPYAYEFEVQPVLDKHCVGCHHNEDPAGGLSFARNDLDYEGPDIPVVGEKVANTSRMVERSFDNLHPYARRPGPESQLMMHEPLEFHASTSPLIQMLEKSHHGVELDREARERLYTWIDLNTPFHGRWNPPEARGHGQAERRAELARRFTSQDVNPEAEYEALMKEQADAEPVEFQKPGGKEPSVEDEFDAEDYAFSGDEGRRLQQQAGQPISRDIRLSDELSITLKRIPAGTFVMGSLNGYPDERPRAVVEIEEPYWMAETEITNAQYSLFDPDHDTGYHVGKSFDKVTPGKIANHADQPVSRVSWRETMAFCDWLSAKSGCKVTLPSEAQWEWAARAGTATRFFWGEPGDDFSEYANLADRRRLYTRTGWQGANMLQSLWPWDPTHHYPLRDDRFDDGALVTNYVGQYRPNAWGLKDMIGNVSEWTRSDYRPYRSRNDHARTNPDQSAGKVARGGSWYERPTDAGAAIRFPYEPWQQVFNVGFRIIVEARTPAANRWLPSATNALRTF